MALATLALAGCGGGSGAGPTIKPEPSVTPDPQIAAVLKADSEARNADRVAKKTADPTYPGLQQTLIDPALSRARSFIADQQRRGIVARGGEAVQHHPHVVDISGAVAVVEDCFYDTSLFVFKATGQPVPDQPGGTQPTWVGTRIVFNQVAGGVWKEADAQTTYGSCPPGY